MMRGIVASEQLLLFCDLHGHSRKRNIFAYGCETLKGPSRLRERVFPRLLADTCHHFSYSSCSFKVLRSKETTGRVVAWRQFSTPNSFTLEASFCGADFGPGAGLHYNICNLKEMGAAFVPALLEFIDPAQKRVSAIMAELEAAHPAADEADEDVEGDQSAKDGSTPDAFGDASEKLRRAVRGRASTNPPKGKASGFSAAAGGTGASARRKPAVDPTKKKKKPATTVGSGSGGLSPRNTRSPH